MRLPAVGAVADLVTGRLTDSAYAAGWSVVRALPEPVAHRLFRAGADLAAARGTREAGAGVNDPEDTAWGDRAAVVTDPDGYRWVLATFKKLVPFSPP